MRLIELSYQDTNWEIQNLKFGDVNLVVGKNAVGKTRTLSIIDLLYKMITQKRNLDWGAKWSIKFENYKKEIIHYEFSTSQRYQGVTYEKILVNNEVVLKRFDRFSASIKSHISSNWDVINPPADKLTLHVRRDVKEYPFLENIVSWAEHSYGFKFGNLSPYSHIHAQEYDLLTTIEDIPALLSALEDNNKDEIIKDFNSLGYDIEDIQILKRRSLIIYIKEKSITKKIPHYTLSQGMFRALSILIYIEYLIHRKKPLTIAIDDLCEGLDYNRATTLGQIIFNKCLDTNIQLIATSNDSFLMDVIDIKYWNVLFREGKTVTAINAQTHEQLFKQFKFTGLSNFDFFASDYITQKI